MHDIISACNRLTELAQILIYERKKAPRVMFLHLCSSLRTHLYTNKSSKMLVVAHIVNDQGYITLPEAFEIVSLSVKYTDEIARQKLLEMPLVSIRIEDPRKGNSLSVIMEIFTGTNYLKLGTRTCF